MKALAIVGVNIRRLLRTPRSLIIMTLGPLFLIFLLGAAFGGGATTHLDLLAPHTRYADQLLRTIARQSGVVAQRVTSERTLRHAVEYGEAEAGVVVPSNYDQALRSGGSIKIRYYAQPGLGGRETSQIVQSGVNEESNEVTAADLLKRERGLAFDAGLAQARTFVAKLSSVAVRTVEPSGKRYPKALQRFTGEAASQLLLFIFITSLTNAAGLVETRRLGITRRMLASPTTVRTVIFGEALGRLAVAGVQALAIVFISWLLFGVEWGNGAAVAVVMVVFCLVAAGFAMLLGSTLATEQQALAFGLLIGLSLAALGGSMVPLLFFPPILLDIAHITPHAWGNEAMIKLLTNDTLAEVLPEIGALAVFAAVTFSLAIWRLRLQFTH
jgi:ABC-2 type transport system permease protein